MTERDPDTVPAADSDQPGRPPRSPAEHIKANLRPQPAIPAVLVLLLTIMLTAVLRGPLPAATEPSPWLLLVPLGILLSCALAVAAGFCSFVPQLAWLALAGWALRLTGPDGPLPAYNRYVLLAGIAAAVAMLGLQLWRVWTGRFVPTISDATDQD